MNEELDPQTDLSPVGTEETGASPDFEEELPAPAPEEETLSPEEKPSSEVPNHPVDADPIPSEAEPTSPEDAPAQDPDPVPEFDPLAEIRQLKDSLAALKALLNEQRERQNRLDAEYTQFASLYPGVPVSSLPDDVWEDVGRGVPIAAAFALSERRRAQKEEQAKLSNQHNSERSPGALSPSEPDVYSPSEVRAMSPAEVRAHFDKIRRSMVRW